MTAVQKAAKAAKKAADAAKLGERVTAARGMLDANPDLLKDRGHPNDYRAKCGDTGRDYVEFLLRAGGAKGRNDACKIIERAV